MLREENINCKHEWVSQYFVMDFERKAIGIAEIVMKFYVMRYRFKTTHDLSNKIVEKKSTITQNNDFYMVQSRYLHP